MRFSTAIVVLVLSLLSSTYALPLGARQNGCASVGPNVGIGEHGPPTFTTDGITITCSYLEKSCSYDLASPPFCSCVVYNHSSWISQTSSVLVGGGDDCPQQVTEQCPTYWYRRLRQAKLSRGINDCRSSGRKSQSSPTVGREREGHSDSTAAPFNTREKRLGSWPRPSLSPRKPTSQPQPTSCNLRYPQKDLMKNPPIGESIRNSALDCRYSSTPCELCAFCKFSTVRFPTLFGSDVKPLTAKLQKTGCLLEGDDGGSSFETAPLTLPQDRRHF
jgi:hypothetical protein